MGVVPFLSTTPSSNVEVALTQSLPDEADEKAARLDEKGDARSLRVRARGRPRRRVGRLLVLGTGSEAGRRWAGHGRAWQRRAGRRLSGRVKATLVPRRVRRLRRAPLRRRRPRVVRLRWRVGLHGLLRRGRPTRGQARAGKRRQGRVAADGWLCVQVAGVKGRRCDDPSPGASAHLMRPLYARHRASSKPEVRETT